MNTHAKEAGTGFYTLEVRYRIHQGLSTRVYGHGKKKGLSTILHGGEDLVVDEGVRTWEEKGCL